VKFHLCLSGNNAFQCANFPKLTSGWQLSVNNSFTDKKYSHRLLVTDRWIDMVPTRYSCVLHKELVKCNFNTDNTVTYCLFTYYVGKYKWKISTSCCCFLMFQTHLKLAQRCYFPHIYCLFFFYHSPFRNDGYRIQVSLYMSREKRKVRKVLSISYVSKIQTTVLSE